LIDGNLKAQRLWWKKTKRKRGAQIGNSNAAKSPKSNSDPITICSEAKRGNSKPYLLDRLEREAPALYDDVLRGKKKAKAAALEAAGAKSLAGGCEPSSPRRAVRPGEATGSLPPMPASGQIRVSAALSATSNDTTNRRERNYRLHFRR
jgi:hypothetical protein